MCLVDTKLFGVSDGANLLGFCMVIWGVEYRSICAHLEEGIIHSGKTSSFVNISTCGKVVTF